MSKTKKEILLVIEEDVTDLSTSFAFSIIYLHLHFKSKSDVCQVFERRFRFVEQKALYDVSPIHTHTLKHTWQ